MNKTVGLQDISLRQHVVYTCSRLLAYGLPLLYFLVAISFYLKTYDSAQVKITFTQIGTTILLFIWLTKILFEGRFPFKKGDLLYVAPFLAYLISGIFSFYMSPYKMWPLEEALRRFFYIILALITISEFRSDERMARLWRWLFAAAWVAIGYGLIQYIDSRFFRGGPGIDPFIWRQAFGHRVFSTFGNPNFYGNFLVIITPLILVSILKNKGSLIRPFALFIITIGLIVCVDKMTLGSFGGFDKSFQIVISAAILLLLGLFAYVCLWKTSQSGSLSLYLLMFAVLFLNLYSTETKGAWLGFVAALSVTLLLIFEFFLHTEDRLIEAKKYFAFIGTLAFLFIAMMVFMTRTFVLPLFEGTITRVGFSLLWIPAAISAVIAIVVMLWAVKKPWNLKKVIYGFLTLFVLSVGGMVLQYAKQRLRSVSFRIFTWIATWEMVQSSPIVGNGVGSFKAIYPAHRRPQIIVLEGKSNTETDHAEDEYIEIWQDEGFLGFGIFIWMVLTALFCGFKQLRWYSKIRPPPEARKKRKLLEVHGNSRSYEVLGIFGAYLGALIHWSVDVSIRFVSSGVFSGLLPGLLVAYARNHGQPVKEEPTLSYERWIRVGLAGIWTVIILALGMELVPQSFIQGGDTTQGQIIFFGLLSGLLIYVLLEVLDRGITKGSAQNFEKFYPKDVGRFVFARVGMALALVVVLTKSLRAFGNHFQADVHHNLAIFFSKQSIWRKSPQFIKRVQTLPPDIKEKYREFGGALEHYDQVIKKNPGFPMARYFTGNVYNDWGSQVFGRSQQLAQQGKVSLNEAQRLRMNALEKWDKAEEAYNGTKSLAPNYVQVHHQVGLLYLKRAQQAFAWRDVEAGKKFNEIALENFYKYRMIDPVFPPNYHRLAEILLQSNEFEKVQKLYEEAIYYNDVVARQIYERGYDKRVSELAVSLGRVYYTHATKLAPDPINPLLPQVQKALDNFLLAVEKDPKNVDGYKGAGRILGLMGKREESQKLLREAFKLSPNDPDLSPSQASK